VTAPLITMGPQAAPNPGPDKPALTPMDPPAEAEAPAPADAPADPAKAPPAAAAKPPKPTFRQSFRETLAWIRDTYCVMEPRTAGVFRWVLGFLCSADLIRHWSEARWFYSNEGILTNHYHLFRPSSNYNFSVFHAFSSLGEVHIIFAFFLFCHLCFMVGWRTKLFSILSFIAVTSLDNRLVMVENGGYVVVNLVVAYAMFLPTGRRFSVDAMLRSFRERKERDVAEINERYRPGWAMSPYVSLAVLLVVLNLAVVYFFNVVNKSGNMWRSGITVHYVLYLNRMVTGVAVLAREILPLWATRLATWSVLCTEALLVAWIMSPYAKRITRTLSMIGIFGLHFTFGVMMRLGPFSWFLIGWSTLLLCPPQWDALEAFYRKKARSRVVVFDRRSPLGFALCRLLARCDNLDLLRFEESSPDLESPPLFAARDPDGGRIFTGMDAFREILQALPGGRYAYWPARVLTLGLLGRLLSLASERRAWLARWLGLAVPPRGKERVERTSPLGDRVHRAGVYARETLLVYVAICSVLQAIAENRSVPPWFKPKLPKVMEATLVYPRMFQGWGMFAPNPITDDGSITVDAITMGGRHIDPFTGQEPDLDLTDSRGLGLGQIRQDYFNRIRLDRNAVFRQGLKDYLLHYQIETGRPEDELVAFDVYWVRDDCPDPGETKPKNNRPIAILTYRKPGYKPPPGQPPLPPEPKTASGDTADSKKTTEADKKPTEEAQKPLPPH
jgi:Vitamin K-dependent gamma-carboxylase